MNRVGSVVVHETATPTRAPHPARHVEDHSLPLNQTVLQGSDPSIPTSTDATLSYVPVVASINDTRFAAPWVQPKVTTGRKRGQYRYVMSNMNLRQPGPSDA